MQQRAVGNILLGASCAQLLYINFEKLRSRFFWREKKLENESNRSKKSCRSVKLLIISYNFEKKCDSTDIIYCIMSSYRLSKEAGSET